MGWMPSDMSWLPCQWEESKAKASSEDASEGVLEWDPIGQAEGARVGMAMGRHDGAIICSLPVDYYEKRGGILSNGSKTARNEAGLGLGSTWIGHLSTSSEPGTCCSGSRSGPTGCQDASNEVLQAFCCTQDFGQEVKLNRLCEASLGRHLRVEFAVSAWFLLAAGRAVSSSKCSIHMEISAFISWLLGRSGLTWRRGASFYSLPSTAFSETEKALYVRSQASQARSQVAQKPLHDPESP